VAVESQPVIKAPVFAKKRERKGGGERKTEREREGNEKRKKRKGKKQNKINDLLRNSDRRGRPIVVLLTTRLACFLSEQI